MKLLIAFLLAFQPVFAQNTSAPINGTYSPGMKSFRNFVKNPDCAKNTNGITASGGSLTKNTTTPLNDDTGTDCQIDASSSGQTYTWAVNTFSKKLKGGNCEASFTYGGDASLYKFYVKQGTVKVTTDLQLGYPAFSQDVQVTFPCGDLSTATTAVIEATSNSAAAMNVAYMYAGGATGVGAVTPAEFVGSILHPVQANCIWDVSSTSYSNYSADTDCSASPTVTGAFTAPATKIPGGILSNLKAGKYFFVATGIFKKNGTTASTRSCWRFSDGTNTSAGSCAESSATSTKVGIGTITGDFTYNTAQSSVTLQLQGLSDGGAESAQIVNDSNSTSMTGLYIAVYRYPSFDQTAIQTNSTLDLTGMTFYVAGSTCPTGSVAADGSAISRTTYAALFSKLGTTHGTGDGSTTFNVPNLKGVFIRGVGSQTISSITYTGVLGTIQGDQLQDHVHYQQIYEAVSNGGTKPVGYLNTTGSATFNYSTGQASSDGIHGTPRAGSETRPANISLTPCISTFSVPAPIYAGSIRTNSTAGWHLESAWINCSSSSGINGQSGSWVTSVGNISSGSCAITLASGIFASAPVSCWANIAEDTSNLMVDHHVVVNSATSLTLYARYLTSGSSTLNNFTSTNTHLTCMGL